MSPEKRMWWDYPDTDDWEPFDGWPPLTEGPADYPVVVVWRPKLTEAQRASMPTQVWLLGMAGTSWLEPVQMAWGLASRGKGWVTVLPPTEQPPHSGQMQLGLYRYCHQTFVRQSAAEDLKRQTEHAQRLAAARPRMAA